MNQKLNISDLVNALEQFGERYHAVDVFADDLSPDARQTIASGSVTRNSRTYRFDVFQEQGVVRLQRADSAAQFLTSALAGAALGAAVAAAAKQKGDGVLGGALLGLLVGGAIGAGQSSSASPRRIFAMQFDPPTSQWRAYDGDLLRWMKERLLEPTRQVANA